MEEYNRKVAEKVDKCLLEKLVELNKKDLRRDYTLGALMRETNELNIDKTFLGIFVLDEDLKKKATQAVDDRLNVLYKELDRREQIYCSVQGLPDVIKVEGERY